MARRAKKPGVGKRGVSRKPRQGPTRMRPNWEPQRLDGRTTQGKAVRARTKELVEQYGGGPRGSVTPQQAMLIRRLVWTEGLAIRWEAELRDLERKGRKVSTFESARYLSIIDRITSLTRRLDETTRTNAGDSNDTGAEFADAMDAATHSHQMPKPPKEKPAKKAKPQRVKPEKAAAPAPPPPPVPPPSPVAPPVAAERAEIINLDDRRRRE